MRRLILSCALLKLSTCHGAITPEDDHFLEQGIAKMESGKLSDALRLFTKGLRANPQSLALAKSIADLRDRMASPDLAAPTKEQLSAAAQRAREQNEQLRKAPSGRPSFTSVKVSSNGDTAATTGATAGEGLLDDSLPDISIDLSDPRFDYSKHGMDAGKAGQDALALQYFWGYAHYATFRADAWFNVALAALGSAKEIKSSGHGSQGKRGGAAHALLCEGLNARAIAKLLNSVPQGVDNVEPSLREALESFGGEYSCESGIALKRRKAAAKALALFEHDSQSAAKMLCRAPAAVRVAITENMKKRRVLPASFVLSFLTRMKVCGVVAVSNMYAPKFIDVLQAGHQEVYDPSVLKGMNVETATIASRGNKRFEIKWPLREPFTDPRLTLNAQLISLVKGAIAGDQIELDTFSHVDALPGATMSNWHEDVDAIHEQTQHGEALHAPPQGVVVIVPVVDLTDENGPTEFIAGRWVK